MKLSTGLVLLAAAALAGCAPAKQEGVVKYKGTAPNTSLQKARGENRELTTYCPGCARSIDATTARCPDKKNCNTQISWTGPYPCGSCKSSGHCSACYWMEQSNGDCYNCKGSGEKIFKGKRVDCPDCKGKKKCPICEGSQKCDYCGGSGRLSYEIVKEKAKKVAKSADDEDTTPVPKKEAAPKPEEKKSEEKPSEEKK